MDAEQPKREHFTDLADYVSRIKELQAEARAVIDEKGKTIRDNIMNLTGYPPDHKPSVLEILDILGRVTAGTAKAEGI